MQRTSLNHAYRLVFNAALGMWVAAPECARGRGKGGRALCQAAAAVALSVTQGLAFSQGAPPLASLPLPTVWQVVAGTASVTQSGTQMTVTQTSARMAANWQTFSIDANHSVQFVQPSATSVALNRVLGPNASVIQGRLSANGQVFLLNPNGVLFSPTSQVNVGGLVASTLDLSNENFMAGRLRFDGASTQTVTNQGGITAAQGGTIAIVAAKIINDGRLTAPGGQVLLGAGQTVTLDFGGPVKLKVERGALDALIANGGAIRADNGTVMLTAMAADALTTSVINHTGVIEARGLTADAKGEIVLVSDGVLIHTGSTTVDGIQGGRIDVKVSSLTDAGQWQARGELTGGSITIATSGHLEQTAAASLDASGGAQGGSVRATSQGVGWFSGSLNASSGAGQGGDVSVSARQLVLAGARLAADGARAGGRVRVGGGWQGNDSDLTNASQTSISATAQLSASANASGNGGTVVVWSEGNTTFGGHVTAHGGALAGDGGTVEISSRTQLTYGGQVDVAAPQGQAGRVLLDPKNITIDSSSGAPASGFSLTQLLDPNPAAGDQHGQGGAMELSNGNIVVGSPHDSTGGYQAGAARLYKPDGTLLSTLVGNAGDQIGYAGGYGAQSSPFTQLANGNYVVSSPNWGKSLGAVTWASGTTGISGLISASNSLVGTTPFTYNSTRSFPGDSVGSRGVTALANGNYVVSSPDWSNGRGASTWGNGTTGISGTVSASNSLVGSSPYVTNNTGGFTSAGDKVTYDWTDTQYGTFSRGVVELPGGDYLVKSSLWGGGKGAVTWASGTAGITGIVSSANSLVGSSTTDGLGGQVDAVTVLTNGNYVVRNDFWNNWTGAVTWGNGRSGVRGEMSAANSLVGTRGTASCGVGYNNQTLCDRVGLAVTALPGGNYVVSSYLWNGMRGAVTWANGATGLAGEVSSGNSLVGTRGDDNTSYGTHNDQVGLPNYGNYNANNANNANNGITVLANGNYVVASTSWNGNRGAATWGSGTSGVSGEVSATNSLVGAASGDNVTFANSGTPAITALPGGNYVVQSTNWNGSAGAVTWGDGTRGTVGAVSAVNSLVGSVANDQVGLGGVKTLAINGNYVVSSPYWNGNAGAVTWVSGASGISGTVSASNSLVGSGSDNVSLANGAGTYGNGIAGLTALTNGNYVVRSPNWNNYRGAVTWADGTTGKTGTVDETNSLVGSHTYDNVGADAAVALTNGNYVVDSSNWSNGLGAVTWGNGVRGTIGAVSDINSLVGSAPNDAIGKASGGSGGSGSSQGITVLPGGNYVVSSSRWNLQRGAVTWGNGLGGTVGAVGATNSLVGNTLRSTSANGVYYSDDALGSYLDSNTPAVTVLANGNYVVASRLWNNGLGSATWGSQDGGVSGGVSSANSLIGSTPTVSNTYGDGYSLSVKKLADGNYAVLSTSWGGQRGAATWASGTTGVSGVISSANSLVGITQQTSAGYGISDIGSTGSGAPGLVALSDGRVLVLSPFWNNQAGRVDVLGPSQTGFTGNLAYATDVGASSALGASQITALLNTGASVTLQASNDLTVAAPIVANNPAGAGGALSLQAGRSIVLNESITSDNGDVTLIANDKLANGVVNAYRDASPATITMATGTRIDAGTGRVNIALRDGVGKTNLDGGDISLRDITAGSILVANQGLTSGSGITLGGLLFASGTGMALELAGQDFVNNAGASTLSAPNGRWLVWSGDPAADARGALLYGFKQYNATYGSSTPGQATGNGLLYSAAPVLTVSLGGSASKPFDGNTTANLAAATFSASGAVDGDSITLGTPATGSYDTATAGTGKTVTATGILLTSASNGLAAVYGYQLSSATTSAAIGEVIGAPTPPPPSSSPPPPQPPAPAPPSVTAAPPTSIPSPAPAPAPAPTNNSLDPYLATVIADTIRTGNTDSPPASSLQLLQIVDGGIRLPSNDATGAGTP
ncbi:hypothetical protein BH11PSE7_BH11PSE7_19070 [soil metagenome]